MLFVTVYVGNLQPGKPQDAYHRLFLSVLNRVCWQPSAWKTPGMPIIGCSQLRMLATYSLKKNQE